ncbi:alpha/beta fold hydrolase [Paraconexibacter antarcticus]|uniref:Alpha/beta fold hydrolase n=1 Tax=Paraconexibacter antarcticus TaxID=2949664 RepID=A0ABY5DW85_9ACTN|nr:alpha/beta fold hydrolase [Paraconexibacter antarcticus]UTI65189.1 alpha/beta fold hydrolase [Paraconexibacter antarcticus]
MSTARLHGQEVSYRFGGEGPAIVLIHGITSSLRTWDGVFEALTERHTVLAPDMLGHGRSGKPRGDYSLGAYASGVRDLMALLGVASATMVGHSLGGGIAMQFAYQFPTRLDRLVLVDSGGLGAEVSPALRAAALPGAEFVVPLMFNAHTRAAGRAVGSVLSRVGLRATPEQHEVLAGLDSLSSPDAREAFLHTVRSVIAPSGQRVDARDRLYLSAAVPTLLVWGERDRIIPLHHGRRAHELMPESRLEVFPGAGHFPFRDDPGRFVDVLTQFVAATQPAALTEESVSRLVRDAGAEG